MSEGLTRLFTEHPASVGESYWQHMLMALKFSGNCAVASLCLFVHAFLPFLFKNTGSGIIKNLFNIMVKKRLEQREKVQRDNERMNRKYQDLQNLQDLDTDSSE